MAPYYYHGQSDPSDWATQKAHPAPWGEIGSHKMVMALPKSSYKTVKDVTSITQYWDKVGPLTA